jgi:hypothetical protein
LESSLQEVFELGAGKKDSDILLVTDGYFWSPKEIIEEAEKSGQRIFAILINSNPPQKFLKELTLKTGGFVSAVMPGENTADTVEQMLQLMRLQRGAEISLHWNGCRKTETLFGGAGFAILQTGAELPPPASVFPKEISGDVLLPAAWTELSQDKASVLEKICAQSFMQAAGKRTAPGIAQKYGLFSKGADFALVKDQADAVRYFEVHRADGVSDTETDPDDISKELLMLAYRYDIDVEEMADVDLGPRESSQPFICGTPIMEQRRMIFEMITARLKKCFGKGRWLRARNSEGRKKKVYSSLRSYIAFGCIDATLKDFMRLTPAISEFIYHSSSWEKLSEEQKLDVFLLVFDQVCRRRRWENPLSDEETESLARKHGTDPDLVSIAGEYFFEGWHGGAVVLELASYFMLDL